MSLTGLREIEEIARQVNAARRARDRRARASRPEAVARRLPSLMRWIPKVSPHLDAPTHLEPLVRELERVLRGETIELTVSVPPRHGKTTTIVHWIVWLLAQLPDLQVLYCSAGAKLAVKQTRAMRALARRIGLPLGEVQTASEWTTASGGRVRACGITGPPVGDGYHVIVVDDPHRSRKDAESATTREGVVTAYRDDIYTRQLPRGTSHVIVHTRWHEADLIGVMTRPRGDEDDGPQPFAKINLPALDSEDRALAPWLWSAERLRRIRARLGPYGWASLYQGSPMPRGGNLFGPATWADDEPLEATHAGGVDLARTAKRRSDPQASIIVSRDADTGIIYVVDIEHERELLTDREVDGEIEPGFIRRIHRQQRAYRGARMRMYTGRDESSILDLFAMHRDYPVIVDAIVARDEKWERAQPTAALWNTGRIRVLRSCRHGEALERQARAFTGLDGGEDDLIDALVAAVDEVAVAETRAEAITPPAVRAETRPVASSWRKRYT